MHGLSLTAYAAEFFVLARKFSGSVDLSRSANRKGERMMLHGCDKNPLEVLGGPDCQSFDLCFTDFNYQLLYALSIYNIWAES